MMNLDRMEEDYSLVYDELKTISECLLEWYDIDKIKTDSVYVWTKDSNKYDELGENVFDIMKDSITYYTDHIVMDESLSTIKLIQEKLLELNTLAEEMKLEKQRR